VTRDIKSLTCTSQPLALKNDYLISFICNPRKGEPITDPAHLPIVSILPGSEKSPKLNDEYNVVTIKLEADAQGRFGFNVKGGVEMQSPVLVSRVAPNTPASRATPPIREGDQVLMINERDVSGLMHEEIVNLIRSSHGNLLLKVKLNREC
jgi:PDZ domain